MYEYKAGLAKNIVSSPVTRQQILLGKMFFIMTVILFVTAISIIFAYGVALYYNCGVANTLMVKDGVCYSVSVYSLFWRQIIGVLAVSILLSSISLIIGYVTNNHFISLLFPFALYLLLYYVLQLFINKGYESGSYVYGYINYFPILNLLEQYIYFWSDFLLMLLFNVFIAVFALILSILLNKRKEY